MNVLDLFLLLLVGISVVAGLMKGLVREIFALVGVLAGVVLALVLSPSLAPRLEHWIHNAPADYAVSLILIFAVTMLGVGLIAHLISKVIELAQLGFANRLLGGLFGLVRGAIMGLVLVLGLTLFLEPSAPILAGSTLLPYLSWSARAMAPLLPEGPRVVLLDRLERLPAEHRPGGSPITVAAPETALPARIRA